MPSTYCGGFVVSHDIRKTTETGVLRSGPRFECIDGAILIMEFTSSAGHSFFEAYFADGCFRMFESENVADLAQAIRELYADPDLCARLVARASEVSEPYRWPYQKKGYLAVVARLVAGPGAPDRRYALAAERAADR